MAKSVIGPVVRIVTGAATLGASELIQIDNKSIGERAENVGRAVGAAIDDTIIALPRAGGIGGGGGFRPLKLLTFPINAAVLTVENAALAVDKIIDETIPGTTNSTIGRDIVETGEEAIGFGGVRSELGTGKTAFRPIKTVAFGSAFIAGGNAGELIAGSLPVPASELGALAAREAAFRTVGQAVAGTLKVASQRAPEEIRKFADVAALSAGGAELLNPIISKVGEGLNFATGGLLSGVISKFTTGVTSLFQNVTEQLTEQTFSFGPSTQQPANFSSNVVQPSALGEAFKRFALGPLPIANTDETEQTNMLVIVGIGLFLLTILVLVFRLRS